MSSQGVQIVALDHRNDIFEDLLIGKEPGCHNDIEDRRVTKQIKSLLTQGAVIHGRLLVRVGHAEALTDVVEK